MNALHWLFRLFGWDLQLQSVHKTRYQVVQAVVNRLTTQTLPYTTPIVIQNAQCLDTDNILLFTEDGRQFRLTVTEIE